MAFEKCSKCGRMHYATDPCKESTAALMEVQLDHQSSGNNMLAEYRTPAGTQALPIDTNHEWRAHEGRADPPLPGNARVVVLFLSGDTATGIVHDWDQNWQWAGHGEHNGNIVGYCQCVAKAKSTA